MRVNAATSPRGKARTKGPSYNVKRNVVIKVEISPKRVEPKPGRNVVVPNKVARRENHDEVATET